MTNREYKGEPLDMSWQDVKDRPYKGKGETVSVSEDESGEESTTGEPLMAIVKKGSWTYHYSHPTKNVSLCGLVDPEGSPARERRFSRQLVTNVPDHLRLCSRCEDGIDKTGESYNSLVGKLQRHLKTEGGKSLSKAQLKELLHILEQIDYQGEDGEE